MSGDPGPDVGDESVGSGSPGVSLKENESPSTPVDDEEPPTRVTRVHSLPGVFLRGLAMGAADAVPGVSGGTIALITGIYRRLIAAVTALNIRAVRGMFAAVRRGRLAILSELRARDIPFLLTLGTGIIAAIVTVARVLDVALEAFPVITFGFFFGLIGASAVVLFSEVQLDTTGRITAAITGFIVAFVLSGRAAAALPGGPFTTALAGAIAVSAMILPGISGSLLLVILGQYERLVGTIAALQDGLLAVAGGADAVVLVRPATTVLVFCVGALIGLFSIAHAVRRALNWRPEATLAFLVSLVVGALRAPVREAGLALAESGGGWSPAAVGAFLSAGVVGAAAVFLLERAAGGIEI